MSEAEPSEELRAFLRECMPNVDAVELLLAMAEAPGRAFEVRDLFSTLRAIDATPALLRRYLNSFEQCGLIAQEGTGYRYAPSTEKLASIVEQLGMLYRERPVTLVRLIYSLREERIRAFADAFNLKKP